MYVNAQPLSLWIQLASLFFTCSGLNGDLLVIRLFLFLAYLMLYVNTILGSPLWPDIKNTSDEGFFLDALIWSIIGMYMHGSSLVCCILDERKPKHLTPDQEALWRLFYRVGGLSQKLFQVMILPYMEVVVYPKEDKDNEDDGSNEDRTRIPTEDYFYIVYQGRVRLQVVLSNNNNNNNTSASTATTAISSKERSSSSSSPSPSSTVVLEERIKFPGDMFDFNHLDFLPAESAFFSPTDYELLCHALPEATITRKTKTKLFRFKKDDIRGKIAHHPFAKSIFQGLLINNLCNMFDDDYCYKNGTTGSHKNDRKNRSSNNNCLVDDDYDREMLLFGPLQDWELPPPDVAGSGSALQRPLVHLWQSTKRGFSLPWWPFASFCCAFGGGGWGHPTGIRQTQLRAPPTILSKQSQLSHVARRGLIFPNTRLEPNRRSAMAQFESLS